MFERKKRRSVSLEELVNEANRLMALPTLTQEYKAGVFWFVDDALLCAGQYNGFGHLPDALEAKTDTDGKTIYVEKPGKEYDRFFYKPKYVKNK